MKNKKEELKKLEREIKRQQKITRPFLIKRDRLDKEIRAENNKKLIGNCYKCVNHYSIGNKWWMYYKIFDADYMGYKAIIIQEDCHGEIEIKTDKRYGDMIRDSKKISKLEFDRQFDKLMSKIKKLK